ncbi:glutathione binding-like protein (plasmid) [Cyanobacterium sp. IPPAS B-1200]|uniref:glutathione binding-like protein n=1 Tax=Cyanobacterium sp. IPPAS B-1200 TaxID=1562720 RepID=UPI00085287FD|nr:glutathione binding-like protein [Cyanobacterium sp. IPPAS B-1200]OEJ80051.1 thiol:disulfide oxidoreductase [Cyanobacterium sp. IPPAS B-1200]
MIELYYWSTPNGHKITIFLEEAGLDYKIIPINIAKGEQFNPEFLSISPNNRIPAIIDYQPLSQGEPISVFESGAILLYLAQKVGKFIPSDIRQYTQTLEWLFWQVGGLGPMAGQNHHFGIYAPEKIPYAIERYVKETNRLYGVLNNQLEGKDYIVGEYSIADMACYPWIVPYANQQQDIKDFPYLEAWFHRMEEREAVIKAYEIAEQFKQPTVTEESRNILFGQTAKKVSD